MTVRRFVALALALGLTGVLTATVAAPAQAVTGQVGPAPQVTINPGGGVSASGTDGLRMVVNADYTTSWNIGGAGQDELIYRGQNQFNYSSSAPVLNIGGTLYGQAGANQTLNSGVLWSSIEVIASSGAVSLGAIGAQTGDASVTLRYTAVRGALSYVMDRTLTYRFPEAGVTEAYAFTIPEGNTEPVKFYLGGDASPGGADSGVQGLMLTEPVRSVMEVNPNSGVQVGFREVVGSKPFDGAVAAAYPTPFATMAAGGDIGFSALATPHDAMLVMQWNLGTAPGTQTASLQTFAGVQAASVSAAFDRAAVATGGTAVLHLSVTNTTVATKTGTGFTLQLPAGLTGSDPRVVGSGCAGTAAMSGAAVTYADGTIPAGASCLVDVDVTAATRGTYEVSSASLTGMVGLEAAITTTALRVVVPPSYADRAPGTLTVGVPVAADLAFAGDPDLVYDVTAGTLPHGLQLDAATGAVTGTPTAAGQYSFTLRATNDGGQATHAFSGSVAKGQVAFSATQSANQVELGDAPTFSVTGLGAVTGTVKVQEGDDVLCTITLPQTSCTPAAPAVGSHTVVAAYSGDDDWLPASAPVGTFDVVRHPTAVTGSLSSTTTSYGTAVTLTLGGVPSAATGSVTVSSAGDTLCTVTLPATSCSLGAHLAPGTYSVALSYSGDAAHAPSQGLAGSLTVVRAPTSLAPGSFATTFDHDVTLSLPGLPAGATGTVTFAVGGDDLCSYDLGDDPASCTVAHAGGLAAGSYVLDARYSGDGSFEPSSSTGTLVVDRASTQVTTSATLDGVYGTPATLSFAGLPATATGHVTVSLGGDELCSVTVASGGCDLPAALPAGTHTLLVTYEGDHDHLGSDAVVTLTVDRAPTRLDVDATVTAHRNATVRVEATGLPAGATGTVTVTSARGAECSWDVATDTSCDVPAFTVGGEQELTLVYSGDADHAGDTATTTVVVAKDSATLHVAARLAATAGDPVTVAFSGLPVDATGTVTVSVETLGGSTDALCVANVPADSSCTSTEGLDEGRYDLTLVYSGDSSYETAVAHGEAVVTAAAADPADPEPTAPKATPAATPGPELAETGASASTPAAGAAGLAFLVVGAVLVGFVRRRRA